MSSLVDGSQLRYILDQARVLIHETKLNNYIKKLPKRARDFTAEDMMPILDRFEEKYAESLEELRTSTLDPTCTRGKKLRRKVDGLEGSVRRLRWFCGVEDEEMGEEVGGVVDEDWDEGDWESGGEGVSDDESEDASDDASDAASQEAGEGKDQGDHHEMEEETASTLSPKDKKEESEPSLVDKLLFNEGKPFEKMAMRDMWNGGIVYLHPRARKAHPSRYRLLASGP